MRCRLLWSLCSCKFKAWREKNNLIIVYIVRVFWTRVTAHLRPRQLHTFTFARCVCSPLLRRNPASLTPLVWLIQPVLLLIRRSTCLNTQVWVTSRDETPSRPQEERFTCEAGGRGQGDLPAQGRRRHPSGVSSRYGKRMRRASSPGDVDGRNGAEKATKSIPQVASIATREMSPVARFYFRTSGFRRVFFVWRACFRCRARVC